MKKYLSCLIIFFLCFALVSCDFDNTYFDKNGQKEPEESSLSISNPQGEHSGQYFEISLSGNNFEDYVIFKDFEAVDFSATTFKDKAATQSLEITILGNHYELEYLESAYLSLNAFPVHEYKIKGTEDSRVLISAQTGKVVKYLNIPIKISHTSEQEYKAFIQEIVGGQCDLADYQYHCTTWRYIFTDTSMTSSVKDGFYVCADNEELGAYSFYFDKEISGIKTLEHISAEFDEDSFSLEMYDFNYESSTFDRILGAMDVLQKEMRGYFESKISDEFTVTNIEGISHTLFIRNGIPYVKSSVNVEYSGENEDVKYVQRVEIIATLK